MLLKFFILFIKSHFKEMAGDYPVFTSYTKLKSRKTNAWRCQLLLFGAYSVFGVYYSMFLIFSYFFVVTIKYPLPKQTFNSFCVFTGVIIMIIQRADRHNFPKMMCILNTWEINQRNKHIETPQFFLKHVKYVLVWGPF